VPKHKPLNLLSPEATGGDTAETGFTFQDALILAKLPGWMARDNFTSFTREAMLDAEAKFFVPGHGFRREGLEAKDYSLTPMVFWDEVDTFRRHDRDSPGTYQWFTLVGTGLSAELRPLANGLRRVRGAYSFYDPGSGVRDNSYSEYQQRVEKLEQDAAAAQFLFEKVLIETDWSQLNSNAEGVFWQQLQHYLPEFQRYTGAALRQAYQNLQALLRTRKGQEIARHEVEAALAAALPAPQPWTPEPVRLFTAGSDEPEPDGSIRLEWNRFSGGSDRTFPSRDIWQSDLIAPLVTLREWMVTARRPRRIRLLGTRRLSSSVAIGSVFSAVAGFSLEMEYRDGVWWRTDAHSTRSDPPPSCVASSLGDNGERLLVVVDIIRDVMGEVRTFTAASGMDKQPCLHLKVDAAITSAEQANGLVQLIKREVLSALQRTGAKEIDLFFAGPAPLALFLGHRLNATAPVQCYERVAPGQYVPTCRLGV
jgi:hypothetical protein